MLVKPVQGVYKRLNTGFCSLESAFSNLEEKDVMSSWKELVHDPRMPWDLSCHKHSLHIHSVLKLADVRDHVAMCKLTREQRQGTTVESSRPDSRVLDILHCGKGHFQAHCVETCRNYHWGSRILCKHAQTLSFLCVCRIESPAPASTAHFLP